MFTNVFIENITAGNCGLRRGKARREEQGRSGSAAEDAALRRLRASSTMATARGAPAEAGRGAPMLGLGSDHDRPFIAGEGRLSRAPRARARQLRRGAYAVDAARACACSAAAWAKPRRHLGWA